MTVRVGHGIVRLPSGREREMTDLEIDQFTDEMVAFGEAYWAAFAALPDDPRGPAYRHGLALAVAEDGLKPPPGSAVDKA